MPELRTVRKNISTYLQKLFKIHKKFCLLKFLLDFKTFWEYYNSVTTVTHVNYSPRR